MIVQRYDSAPISEGANFERTGSGGVRTVGNLTRVGVLGYTLPDGSQRNEWRPREEVGLSESLTTLHDAPVTILHPAGGTVTPENYRMLAGGHVGADVALDGDFVRGSVVLTTEDAVDAVLTRDMRELSCGYTSRLDFTPGVVPEGEPDAGSAYDCIQREIKYNHVALLPRGKGRAGPEVSLRLDSNGHQIEPLTTPTEEKNMELTHEELAALKALAESSSKIMKMLADAEAAEAAKGEAAPKADGEPVAPPATAPEAPDPAAEAADRERLVMDSVDIREKARAVLGASHVIAGKSNREIMTETVRHVDSKFAIPTDDGALRVAFEMSLARHTERLDSKGELADLQRKTVLRIDASGADSNPTGAVSVLRENIQKASRS